MNDDGKSIPKYFKEDVFNMAKPHHPDAESEGTVRVYDVGMKAGFSRWGQYVT